MIQFELFTRENAPKGSENGLMEIEKKAGFIPNLQRVMAQAPSLLEGYLCLWKHFENCSLTPIEQQVVLLATSVENGCTYCVAAHTGLARLVGLSKANLDALRELTPLPDDKLNALRNFTTAMVKQHGWVSDKSLAEFLAAGYGRQQVLEVILGIAHKIMSNFTNHVASTPLDKVFENDAWLNNGTSII